MRHVTTRRPHTPVARAGMRGRPRMLVARGGMRGRPRTLVARAGMRTRDSSAHVVKTHAVMTLYGRPRFGLTGRSALNAEFISARIAAMTALIPIKRLMVYFWDRNNVRMVPMR